MGWPPIRSSRRNLTSSSFSKPASDSDAAPSKLPTPREKPVEIGGKGLFVKINMDGVPIGRKIDLNAYDSYEKLSSAVDELFRGLLAGNLHKNCSSILLLISVLFIWIIQQFFNYIYFFYIISNWF